MIDINKLLKRRPKGGFLDHLIPRGKYTALCGYTPSSPTARQMAPRHGWVISNGYRDCARCAKVLERLEQEQAKEDEEALMDYSMTERGEDE